MNQPNDGGPALIPESEWEWYGNAAHFCCASWCRFHMATKVGGYLISTVGEFVHPRHSMGSERAEAQWLAKNYPGEDIGIGRKYETMVFKAGQPCDAPECCCGVPKLDGHELDCEGYNKAGDARAGHLAMCQKWADALLAASAQKEEAEG